MLGLYYLPIPFVIHETGLKEKEVLEAFKFLEEEGFSMYDYETEFVWIPTMARWQIGEMSEKDNKMRGIQKLYRDLPDNPYLEAFYEAHHEALFLDSPRAYKGDSKGFGRASEGLGEPLPRAAYPGPVPVPAPAPVDKKAVKELKAFDSDPSNVLALWNETVTQWGISEAPPLTAGVRAKVREALKYLKTREQWLQVFAEIPLSPFLMGRAGDKPFTPTLEWVVGHKTGDPTENYYKMLQGNYRDKNINGMDQLTRRNIEAAERALINMGIPPKAQTAILKGIADGSTVETDHCSTPSEVGDGLWTDAEYGEDRDLPGASGGIYGRAGDQRDYVGDGEYEPLSDDRRFEDSDRGE
jgi:hypothetical protein